MASPGTISLQWTAAADDRGVLRYDVYRSTAGGTPTKVGSPTPATGTTYTDSTAVNGTAYTYTVKALNGTLASGDSTPATATPKAAATAPAAPTGLAATAGDAKVDLI